MIQFLSHGGISIKLLTLNMIKRYSSFLVWTSCRCKTLLSPPFVDKLAPSAILLSCLTASVSLRKGTTATAMGTPGCLTCRRSVSTCTARLPRSHTRPRRTSSRLTSRLLTSPSPTRSPATPTPTSATPSTLTPYTSHRRRTSSSLGPAGRARTGSARTPGAAWLVRSWVWREDRPG